MTNLPHGLTRFDMLAVTNAAPRPPFRRTFGRLFEANPLVLGELSDAVFVKCLDDLSETMRQTEPEFGEADAGMPFFGQFIDHDITRDASSAIGTRMDPSTIANVRTPSLDLDSVYGDGPSASPHLYGPGKADHFLMFGRRKSPRDFARTDAGKALIGDPRNDENIILAQIHGAFSCLHNILMTKMLDDTSDAQAIAEIGRSGISDRRWQDMVPLSLQNFEEVRRFIRLHYQWIVWNEYLPALVDQDSLTAASTTPFAADVPVMPIEFSGACYRFGHATIQPAYRLRQSGPEHGLFQTKGFGPRSADSDLDFSAFFTMYGRKPQKARPVSPGVAAPLYSLPFVKKGLELRDANMSIPIELARKLPLRSMLRDRYTYQLPSGQMVAKALGLDPLDPPPELHGSGLTRTPLWYYSLQEAALHGNGKLCGAGGRIVASVFENLLSADLTTYRHVPNFKPWSGFEGQPTILSGLLDFVETYRENVAFADKLISG